MLLGRSTLALAAFLQPVLYHIKYCINLGGGLPYETDGDARQKF